MNQESREKIYQYLREKISQSNVRVKAYVFDDKNNKNPTRNCFVKLRSYVQDFLLGKSAIRWIVMPGFRGVGKTTLLAQLYFDIPSTQAHKLFLSVDEIVQILGVSLADVLSVYEELIGTSFEKISHPIILFLDEVHYDKQWAILLKTIFDRSKKVFIVATGSSALTIQQNTDVARRAITEKLYPMSFPEYIKIKTTTKYEIKGLGAQIKEAIYTSKNAEEVYGRLLAVKLPVQRYWLDIDRMEVEKYLKYGTLPFAVPIENEGLVYDQIKKIVDRIIGMDVRDLGRFEPAVINRIPNLLYTLASTDVVSLYNLEKDTGINRNTLGDILATLEQTEMITRIYPYAAHGTQVRQPSKYLFSSPAFRSMYYSLIGNTITPTNYMGKLLEDIVVE